MSRLDLAPLYERETARATETSREEFDRVEYTARALDVLRAPGLRVAICEGARSVRVTVGRQWGGNLAARWAIVSVPRDASRRAIGEAILLLATRSTPPFATDCVAQMDRTRDREPS